MELIPVFIFIFIIFFSPVIICSIVKYTDNHKQNLHIKRLFENKTHISIDITNYDNSNFDLKLENYISPMGYAKIKIIYLENFQAFQILANAILEETGPSSICIINSSKYSVSEYCLVNYKNRTYVIHTNYKTFKEIKKYCYQLEESKKQKQINENFTKQIEASVELFKEIRDDNKKISEKEIRLASDTMDAIKLQIENNELFPKLNYKEEKEEESIFPSVKRGLEEAIEYEENINNSYHYLFRIGQHVKISNTTRYKGIIINEIGYLFIHKRFRRETDGKNCYNLTLASPYISHKDALIFQEKVFTEEQLVEVYLQNI